MKSTPLVTVIIPDRQKPQFVIQAIGSVYSQTKIPHKQIEIIIVIDYNSNYQTHQIIDKYPEVKIIPNNDKEGPGGSRNTGLSQAHGEYIAFLDSDDQWGPDFLEESLKILKRNPKVAATWSMSHTIFENDFPLKEKPKLFVLNFIRDLMSFFLYVTNNKNLSRSGFYLPQISHLIFRTKIAKQARFDYRYRRGGEDWAYFARVMSMGNIQIIPKRLVLFRYSAKSSTMTAINRRLKWQSYARVLGDLPSSYKSGLLHQLFLAYLRIGPKSG